MKMQRREGKVCNADQFSELCGIFRSACRRADVVASPQEARDFARMKGKAYQWLCLELEYTPSKDQWMNQIRKEAENVSKAAHFIELRYKDKDRR